MQSETVTKDTIKEYLKGLSTEAKELYLSPHVPELDASPESALSFYRDWVSQNRPGRDCLPVLFKGAIKHWPAFQNWNKDYFRHKLGSKNVTVAVTPNGYADAISSDQKYFAMPHETQMTMHSFLEKLEAQPEGQTHYIQKQNSNLTDEFRDLFDDVSELTWASQAFGKTPDAVNFWMGDERCVTSTHKDPYENIYCVVRGHKDIILHPPTDLPWLYYRSYSPAVYCLQEDDSFSLEPCPKTSPIPWVSVDPLQPDLDAFPDYKNSFPIKVRVCEGDALYLPSLWFHHLRQSHGCVAVNFWYDMEFDIKYNYFANTLSTMANLIK